MCFCELFDFIWFEEEMLGYRVFVFYCVVIFVVYFKVYLFLFFGGWRVVGDGFCENVGFFVMVVGLDLFREEGC